MNKIAKSLVAACVAASLLVASCAQFEGFPTDSAITLATVETLKNLSPDRAKVVANYIDYVATQIRAIKGVPTTQEFLILITKYVPADIKAKYPELVAFVSNKVGEYYQKGLDKYGNDATKVYAWISRIALDLEAGAAQYAGK